MKDRLRRISMAVGASLFALLVAACDLNPQPLPPGFTGGNDQSPGTDGGTFAADDAGTHGGGGREDASAPVNGPDSGSSGSSDAGVSVDAGNVSDATVPPGADASADATSDSPSDAESDAETDAPTDTGDAAEDAPDGEL